MTVRLDASGGTSSAGSGGNGGTIYTWVQNGQLINGSGPGRAGIDNNIISQASLTGGTVTMTELFNDSGVAYSNDGAGTAFIDLFGFDFFVPAGVTLDLSDAVVGTIDRLVITTHMPNDYIRIDGTVLLARTGDPGVNLRLVSGAASGLGISVDGTINADGDAGENGTNVEMDAMNGSIAIGGTITSRGGPAGMAGNGGEIFIQGRKNHVWIASGIWDVSGGQGSTNGGDGGRLEPSTGGGPWVHNFNWGLRANGGRGMSGTGGNVGQIDFYMQGETQYFCYIQANGGQGAVDGGSAIPSTFWYAVELIGGTAMGVLQIESNGGQGGTGTGGTGGYHSIYPHAMQSLALVIEANGGNSTSGAGGSGYNVYTYAYYEQANQVLLDVSTDGGTGTIGGDGGNYYHYFYADAQNVTVRYSSNGGVGSTGSGGDAGYFDTGYYGDAVNATYDIVMHGGAGATTGGDGGSADIEGDYNMFDATVRFEANGGQGGTGVGGAGGDLWVEAADDGYGGYFRNVLINAMANGGNSTSGNGGSGGEVEVQQGYYFSLGQITVNAQLNGGNGVNGGSGGYFGAYTEESALDVTMNIAANGGTGTTAGGSGGGMETDDDEESFIFRGTFTARGGLGLGAGTGGSGGYADRIYARGYISFLEFRNVTFDLRGGDSEQGAAGSGGDFVVRAGGTLSAIGLTVDVSGGFGGTVSGSGSGGSGGYMEIYNDGADSLISNTTLRANGGDGRGAGAGGGGVYLTCDSGGNGRGGFLSVNATVTANGGSATVSGDGGAGGDIEMWAYQFGAAIRVGEAEFRGAYSANGGNGAGAGGAGGNGGEIDLLGGLQFLRCWATLSVNGGNGTTGGVGGDVEIYNDEGGDVVIGGNITANGGVGGTTGGTGGDVYVGYYTTTGAAITVNSGVLIQANGGGPNASAAGAIWLNSFGAGVTTTGATLQTNDGTGTAVANITQD